jgi:hypothetical protein
MAWGRAIRTLKCNSVYLTHYQSMKIPVSFQTSYARADKQILVDSGATDNFIDPRLIKRLGLRSLRLERPRKIWNIDGTNNKAGMISDYLCYVFSYYNCARNRLSLGPSLYFVITSHHAQTMTHWYLS